ncbi:Phosphate-selective porin O and P [Fodinibius roseus]|uniref:Phosphate-selective porin O and P n=1 Tax=Fodinibius roseus TaxID=1194090 RepID=A0A1M5HID3_9BACT|nr:porin [Fodinibius roseus]SHG15723.1 Phosphate-selective porin O and P [Fodinibius roseus]
MDTTHKIFKFLFSTALFCLVFTALSSAQQKKQQNSEYKQLQEKLKTDTFSFGLLIQGLADIQPERSAGHNGFKASKGRFKISGIFDGRFGYNLQATMLKTPSVLDANVYYKPTANLSIKGGVFKSPFTHEYNTGAGSILFVNRSAVVNQLGTKRQVGVQIDGFTPNGLLRYTAGVFNGSNYGNNKNDDDYLQYMGRLEGYLNNNGKNRAKVGVSVAVEQKDVPSAYGNIPSTFEGDQKLMTSYFSITQGKILLDGEFIYSWLESPAAQNYNPYGYYATVGYYVAPKGRLLLRWDSFTGDNLTGDSESLIAGFNYYPSSFAKVKLNYILPTDQSVEYSTFLVAMQISF